MEERKLGREKRNGGKGDLKGGEWKGDVNIYGLKL